MTSAASVFGRSRMAMSALAMEGWKRGSTQITLHPRSLALRTQLIVMTSFAPMLEPATRRERS